MTVGCGWVFMSELPTGSGQVPLRPPKERRMPPSRLGRDKFRDGARGEETERGEMNSPLQEDQDAGLPDKNRQDPHKPGESPALQNRRADGALQPRKRRQAAALQNRPLHSLENVEPARHLAISRVSSDLGLRYSSD